MSGDNYKMPVCPICGKDCNELFIQEDGDTVVGCDRCIHTESAEERLAEDDYDARANLWDR